MLRKDTPYGNTIYMYIKTASSLLFFFAWLLHGKPKHVSGAAASRDKRGRKREKKK